MDCPQSTTMARPSRTLWSINLLSIISAVSQWMDHCILDNVILVLSNGMAVINIELSLDPSTVQAHQHNTGYTKRGHLQRHRITVRAPPRTEIRCRCRWPPYGCILHYVDEPGQWRDSVMIIRLITAIPWLKTRKMTIKDTVIHPLADREI